MEGRCRAYGVEPIEAFDMHTVATQEIGHFFGLAHSLNKEALMFASINPGTTKELVNYDIDGIQALYILMAESHFKTNLLHEVMFKMLEFYLPMGISYLSKYQNYV